MISILMPIYNRIEFINETVQSILEQTYDKWELLIGVNGYNENSEVYNFVKSLEERSDKVRVFDFYNIKGKANTLNEMIKYCNYDYIALLDVDDIWYPQKLEVQSVWLNNYDVIGTNCILFGGRTGIVPSIPKNDFSNFDFEKVNPIINSSVVVRKELCWWDSKINGAEDYDLWFRIRQQNKRFYNCPQITVKHKVHNMQVPNLLKSHGLKRG